MFFNSVKFLFAVIASIAVDSYNTGNQLPDRRRRRWAGHLNCLVGIFIDVANDGRLPAMIEVGSPLLNGNCLLFFYSECRKYLTITAENVRL